MCGVSFESYWWAHSHGMGNPWLTQTDIHHWMESCAKKPSINCIFSLSISLCNYSLSVLLLTTVTKHSLIVSHHGAPLKTILTTKITHNEPLIQKVVSLWFCFTYVLQMQHIKGRGIVSHFKWELYGNFLYLLRCETKRRILRILSFIYLGLPRSSSCIL